MEDHDYETHSISHLNDFINGATVANVLRAARLSRNEQKEKECMRFLRAIVAPKLVGESAYWEIGKEFDIDFIKERSATLFMFSSIASAMVTGQRVYSFRRQPNCKFVELLDSSHPRSPVGLTAITDRSILRALRWAYKKNNLLVLKEYEVSLPQLAVAYMLAFTVCLLIPKSSYGYFQHFLCAYPGRLLFNEYQILHMANRFDFPDIRTGILMKIRTIEDIDAFKRDENYESQLSMVDKELFDIRADNIRKVLEKGIELTEPEQTELFTYDVRNGCSALSSCATRYVELSDKEKEDILEVEDNVYRGGFNAVVTDIIF
ncbi:hypothetical protein PRIPAC_91397 [Pristionchus pacificus]|uniref:Uncharacterized protein n=1 Tax=Pristionchus pacificus TaxID=54126 RepID=A0A2A6B7X1_PRIPA|nr:hypothetical protein PRIPAC_91397 [Pristionchus pacificus]|eukprot:PDM61964.1 hypothetical protein PRIPAC_51406 [Pristionchus pacificus]